MGIVLYRLDDRLIHGQVVEGWFHHIRPDLIVVADDAAAANDFQKSLMEMVVPMGIRSEILTIREAVERAAAIAQQTGAVLSVKPIRQATVGIVITGSEVYHGLIEDRFAPILTEKVTTLGGEVIGPAFAPDDAELISRAIRTHLDNGCDLILLSGGMSVDPDDVTRQGIRRAGADEVHYGAAVLPGAMFLVAYIGSVPLLGVPACGLHHRITVLDLVLPRILTGEKIGKAELAFLGHGGLCKDCQECSYPHCPFGK